MSFENRRIEEAERKVVRLYLDLANLRSEIAKVQDGLKDLTGGSGPGSKGGGLFPGIIGGGGGGYWTDGGGINWGDGTGDHGHRGGLVDSESDWNDTIPWPGSGACRLYVYVYDSSTSAPLSGATVTVTITGGSTTRTTNSSGYCSFDIANGISATIVVSDSGYTTQTRTVTISAGYRGIHRENFNLNAAAPPNPGDPCTLDVLVKDSSGSPINDAPVKIIEAGVETVHNTDSSGHASFSVTQGESLTIDVYPTGYNSQTRSITVNAGSDGTDHQTFNLDNAGALSNIIVSVKETGTGTPLTCYRASGGGTHYDNNMTVTFSNGTSSSLTYPADDGASTFPCSNIRVGETITVRIASFVRKTAGAFVGGVFGYNVATYAAGSQSVGPVDASGAQSCQIVLPHPTVTFEPY